MEENQNWPFIFTGCFGIAFATLVSYVLYLRARHHQNLELIASSFPSVVNFSLNFMENGTLKFRTLFETNVETLARNPVLAQILADSRDCCTEDRAFFSEPRQKSSFFSSCRCCRRLRVKIWGPQIEWKKASEHLHMAILNELSSRYSQGHFGHGIIGLKIPATVQPKHTQLDVVSETFCFGLTCEQNKDIRAKKVRVMIAAKDFLRHQVSSSAPEPKLERPGHWVRWRTLLEMKQIMEEEERLRTQGIRRVSRVWEVTLSFMVPRLRAASRLMFEKEGVMSSLDGLSKQLRSSSDQIFGCTGGHGPRGKKDVRKFQTSPHGNPETASAESQSPTSPPRGNRRTSSATSEVLERVGAGSSREKEQKDQDGGSAREPEVEPASTVVNVCSPAHEAPPASSSTVVPEPATDAAPNRSVVLPVAEPQQHAEPSSKAAPEAATAAAAGVKGDEKGQGAGVIAPETPKSQHEAQSSDASMKSDKQEQPQKETQEEQKASTAPETAALPAASAEDGSKKDSSAEYDEGVEVESMEEDKPVDEQRDGDDMQEDDLASPSASPTLKAPASDESAAAAGLPGQPADGEDLLD